MQNSSTVSWLSKLNLNTYPTLMRGLKELSESKRRTRLRRLARTDLYFLLRYLCGRRDLEHQWLLDRCREVQAQPDGYLDLWAREHYKSTIITYGLTIQDILRTHGEDAEGDEQNFGIFSHTRPMSKAFLRQIKWEFENNQVLQQLFDDVLYENPRREAPKWSEDDGLIVKRKQHPKEATVEAWGLVDGQPTGRHFQTLVYDDVVTWPASVSTPEAIIKTTDAFRLSLNLGARHGRKRMVGTRYAFGDSYNTIMEQGTVRVREYPGTEDGSVEGKPVLLSEEEIKQKRRDMGPYIFSCQILQNPIADEKQSFSEDWLSYYRQTDHTKLNLYLLCDPASSKKKTSDYTAMGVLGLGADGNTYLVDGLYDRLNLVERTDALFEFHRMYRPLSVGYEQYGLQADIEHFESEMERESYRFVITPLGGKLAKIERIKRLVPDFEAGRFLLPGQLFRRRVDGSTYDPVKQFVREEYKPFPAAIHDDFFDMMSRIKDEDMKAVGPSAVQRRHIKRRVMRG